MNKLLRYSVDLLVSKLRTIGFGLAAEWGSWADLTKRKKMLDFFPGQKDLQNSYAASTALWLVQWDSVWFPWTLLFWPWLGVCRHCLHSLVMKAAEHCACSVVERSENPISSVCDSVALLFWFFPSFESLLPWFLFICFFSFFFEDSNVGITPNVVAAGAPLGTCLDRELTPVSDGLWDKQSASRAPQRCAARPG